MPLLDDCSIKSFILSLIFMNDSLVLVKLGPIASMELSTSFGHSFLNSCQRDMVAVTAISEALANLFCNVAIAGAIAVEMRVPIAFSLSVTLNFSFRYSYPSSEILR